MIPLENIVSHKRKHLCSTMKERQKNDANFEIAIAYQQYEVKHVIKFLSFISSNKTLALLQSVGF